MAEAAKDPEIGMVHGQAGDFGIGGYDLFLIKDWVVQDYGLFDENFYPVEAAKNSNLRHRHKPVPQHHESSDRSR